MYVSIWCHNLNLSSRSLVIALVVCVTLVYFSYSFNACLFASLTRTLQQVSSPSSLSTGITSSSPLLLWHLQSNLRNLLTLQQQQQQQQSATASTETVPSASSSSSSVSNSTLSSGLAQAIPSIDGAPKYQMLRQQGLRPSRHLPDTLIIGVKKSGTRALLEFIRLHPDVRAAGSEVHFFDRHFQRGLRWYRHHMPYTIEGQITMEKTPSYFVTKEVPQRVYHMNAATK